MSFKNLVSVGFIAIALSFVSSFASAQDGWIIKDSANSVSVTADKLVAIIEKAPPKLFARVDHSAGAKNAGLELPAATMVMFGVPAIGTPIMQENLMAGIDLPIRVLIWDDKGQTKIGYLAADALAKRYSISGAEKALKQMAGALDKFTSGAAK